MRIALLPLLGLPLVLAGCSSNATTPTVAPKPTPAPPAAAATPMFSLAAGTFNAVQTVTISDATAGATIYYTTDGTPPTVTATQHTGTQYTGPITVSATETLMAVAAAPGFALSAVQSALYTIALPPPPPPAHTSVTVRHGQMPLAGAHLYVLAANTTGYGKPSVSLLDAALTSASDAIGAYLTTGLMGASQLTGTTPAPRTLRYISTRSEETSAPARALPPDYWQFWATVRVLGISLVPLPRSWSMRFRLLLLLTPWPGSPPMPPMFPAPVHSWLKPA